MGDVIVKFTTDGQIFINYKCDIPNIYNFDSLTVMCNKFIEHKLNPLLSEIDTISKSIGPFIKTYGYALHSILPISNTSYTDVSYYVHYYGCTKKIFKEYENLLSDIKINRQYINYNVKDLKRYFIYDTIAGGKIKVDKNYNKGNVDIFRSEIENNRLNIMKSYHDNSYYQMAYHNDKNMIQVVFNGTFTKEDLQNNVIDILCNLIKLGMKRDIQIESEYKSTKISSIDPLLIKRTGSSYGRVCQGVKRKPEIITDQKEIKRLKEKAPLSIFTLKNITYDGKITYHAKYKEFPYLSFKRVDKYCLPCCSKNPPQIGSSKLNQWLSCAEQLFYDKSEIPKELLKKRDIKKYDKISRTLIMNFNSIHISYSNVVYLPNKIDQIIDNGKKNIIRAISNVSYLDNTFKKEENLYCPSSVISFIDCLMKFDIDITISKPLKKIYNLYLDNEYKWKDVINEYVNDKNPFKYELFPNLLNSGYVPIIFVYTFNTTNTQTGIKTRKI